MRLNPEFRRYFWLELSLQRLIALPVVLVAVFWLTWLISDDPLRSVTSTALTLFYLGTTLWGSRLAANSVVGEVRDATWDWQRMSAIRPWPMTWGKLIGSTVFVWLSALLCLLVYAAASIVQGHGGQLTSELIVVVMIGLLAQAVALTTSLLWLRKTEAGSRTAVVMPQFLGLLAGFFAVSLWGDWAFVRTSTWDAEEWYGQTVDPRLAFLLSLAIFLGWTLLAAGRLMRGELQVRQWPWAWPAFTIFLMIYMRPIRPEHCQACNESLTSDLVLPFLVALALAYLAFFIFPKQPVQLRALSLAWRARTWNRALCVLPLWSISLAIALAAGIGLVAADLTSPPASGFAGELQRSFGVLAILAFLLRDLAIILLLNLGGRIGRGDLAAAIYLILLHVIVPDILALVLGPVWSGLTSGFIALQWDNVSAALFQSVVPGYELGWEHPDLPMVALVSGTLQATLLLLLLWLRWTAFQAAFEKRLPVARPSAD